MPTNTFSDTPARGATGVQSVIHMGTLLPYLTGDAYFQETGDVARVDMYYNHTGGRQEKRIIHSYGRSTGLSGSIQFSPYAIPGVWEKTRIQVTDPDGAIHDFTRQETGLTGEDLTIAA